MEIISHEELVNKYIGEKGTPKRNRFDDELTLYSIANHLKELRVNQNMTQEELGKKIGKDKTQISKIEKGGRNLTLDTVLQVVHALNATISLNIKTNKEVVVFGDTESTLK